MPPGGHSTKLFINYRREDTAPYAGRLYDRLVAHFGENQVFIDIDQIDPGEDFVEVINSKVGSCEIAIVSIGPNWLTAKDASGQRRLDDSEDFVRIEIIAALERKIRVIPVLVGGARMPRKQDLPEALAPLSRRNAIELSETRFHADVSRLIEAIEKTRASSEKKPEPLPGPIASLSEPVRLAKSAQPENLPKIAALQSPTESPSGPVASTTENALQTRLSSPKSPQVTPAPTQPDRQDPPPSASQGKRTQIRTAALVTLLVIGVCGFVWFGTWLLNVVQSRLKDASIGVTQVKNITPQAEVEKKQSVVPQLVRKEEARKKADSLRPVAAATKEQPYENNLGMKFVPVAGTGVLFSIWETRVKDFEAFVEATGHKAESEMDGAQDGKTWAQPGRTWKDPGFAQTGDHAAFGMTWNDATAFCEWLTEMERKAGGITAKQRYRLPTDEEWSVAVGLEKEEGSTPESKDMKDKGAYPWGPSFPPPGGAGNYAGSETRPDDWPSASDRKIIDGYRDEYPRISPAGSFSANEFGIHDLGGNVWEWCEDWWNAETKSHVLRGASWRDFSPFFMLSSSRAYNRPDARVDKNGFRCVLAFESSL